MKTVIYVLVFLLVFLHIRLVGTDLADADYCINFYVNKFGERDTMLSFVKGYKVLSPLRFDIEDTVECVNGGSDTTVRFNFVDKKTGIQHFISLGHFASGRGSIEKIGHTRWRYGYYLDDLPPVIQIKFPLEIRSTLPGSGHNKDSDLLSFKNKIIDAYIEPHFYCPPHLDTTFRIDFRARITGECEK